MNVESFHNWELDRAIREQRLLLTNVAKEAGMDPSFLSYIKRGRMRPTDEEEKAIAKVLGMEVRDLFTVKEPISST